MRLFRTLIALAIAAVPAAAFAQDPFLPGRNVTDANPQPIKPMCWTGSAWASCGPAAPAPVTSKGSATILTGQVTVGTTAVKIVNARSGRQFLGVAVTSAVQCAFGPAGVTLTTGWPLAAVAYASDQWSTQAELWGICASPATTVAWREQY